MLKPIDSYFVDTVEDIWNDFEEFEDTHISEHPQVIEENEQLDETLKLWLKSFIKDHQKSGLCEYAEWDEYKNIYKDVYGVYPMMHKGFKII